MEYECQIVPLDKIFNDHYGVKVPLCNNCVQTECTNPIKTVTLSICGVPQTWRLWSMHNYYRQVVGCDGYIHDETKK